MKISKLDTIKATKKNSVGHLFALSVVISPLFLLTVSGWMTRIVVVCALLSIIVIYNNKNKSCNLNALLTANIKTLSLTFALPFFAIFFSQSFRGQYSWSYYDSPLHILICIFVLWAMLRAGSRIIEFMSHVFPLALLLALANVLLHPNLNWGVDRISTQALDPLDFGSLSLTFGLLSLASIKVHKKYSTLLTLYKLIGFCAGLYLSIASGSRTGWLALPVVALLWIYFEQTKFRMFTKFTFFLGLIFLVLSTYFFSATVHQRTVAAANEVINYHWDTPNVETSVGARISFARMAIFLLEKKPLSGWGDGGFETVINDPALNFSATTTKRLALNAGFHNDITANMVRSGIWGLIATLALFLVPAIFFMRNMLSCHKNQSNVAFLAMTFLICQFTSSLSMEIFNLRYSASFYGLMIAAFSGQILFYRIHNVADEDAPK